ncbi:MAG: phage tail fiber protein [bacterium]
MGSATSYFENLCLDAILGDNKGASMPATVYVALFTTTPDDGGGGTEVSTTGTGYARVAVTNNSTNWPAAAGGIKSNGTTVTFPTATDSWGNIQWVAIYDAATAGNMLLWGETSSTITPVTGNTPFFSAGGFAITCD